MSGCWKSTGALCGLVSVVALVSSIAAHGGASAPMGAAVLSAMVPITAGESAVATDDPDPPPPPGTWERVVWSTTQPIERLVVGIDIEIVEEDDLEAIAYHKNHSCKQNARCNSTTLPCADLGVGPPAPACRTCDGSSGLKDLCFPHPTLKCQIDPTEGTNGTVACGNAFAGTCTLVGGVPTCTTVAPTGSACFFKACIVGGDQPMHTDTTGAP